MLQQYYLFTYTEIGHLDKIRMAENFFPYTGINIKTYQNDTLGAQCLKSIFKTIHYL